MVYAEKKFSCVLFQKYENSKENISRFVKLRAKRYTQGGIP